MAWVRGDWDRLGEFLSKGLSAYTSERQRRQQKEERQAQLTMEQERAEAYIDMLNEQMEASQERRARDAQVAERLQMPMGQAWTDGPESVPLGEMGAYTNFQEQQRRGTESERAASEAARGQEPVDQAMLEMFPEGLPQGLTREDFEMLLPYLMKQQTAMKLAELEGAGGAGGMPAAMIGQIEAVQERMRMDALYDLAGQDPELLYAIQDATNKMTGDLEWSKLAEYLGPGGWQDLMDLTQYKVDDYMAGKGIVTPGMGLRHQSRMGMGEEVEPGAGGEGIQRRGMIQDEGGGERGMTTEERRSTYLAEHPGLQNPAMAGLLADPQALDILAKKELYGERGPASGFAALEQMDLMTGQERPWAGWAEEIRRRKEEELRRKELASTRGRQSRVLLGP